MGNVLHASVTDQCAPIKINTLHPGTLFYYARFVSAKEKRLIKWPIHLSSPSKAGKTVFMALTSMANVNVLFFYAVELYPNSLTFKSLLPMC